MSLFESAEELLVAFLAHTQHHQLNVIVHHNAVDAVGDQIQTLVRCESRDDRQHGNVRSFGQTALSLERQLIRDLSFHLSDREGRVDRLILCGIVIDVINSVQNAAQLVCVAVEAIAQSVGILCGADLLRIARADRAHPVGAFDRRLHEVDASAVFHQHALAVIQSEHVSENGEIVLSLVFDIVNGEHRLDVPVSRSFAVEAVEINHRQRRLPVMRVQHVGIEIHSLEHLHRRHAEKCVSLGIVEMSVEGGTLEIILVVNEIEGHAVLDETVDPAILPTPGEIHLGDALLLHLLTPCVGNASVKRHDHSYVHLPRCRERRRE